MSPQVCPTGHLAGTVSPKVVTQAASSSVLTQLLCSQGTFQAHIPWARSGIKCNVCAFCHRGLTPGSFSSEAVILSELRALSSSSGAEGGRASFLVGWCSCPACLCAEYLPVCTGTTAGVLPEMVLCARLICLVHHISSELVWIIWAANIHLVNLKIKCVR